MNPMLSNLGLHLLRKPGALVFTCVLFSVPGICETVTSLAGTLSTPESTVLLTLDVATPGNVTLQTYGFGGGTNAAGTIIASGGFDPFVGLFSGLGDSAIFINGTSDILSTYSPGCPPAGLVTIGSVAGQCGDVNLTFTGLAAGLYTVLLSDGEYVPNAVFEASGGTLGDGFADLTGGVFQTCYDSNDCNTDTGNWALDITAPAGSSVPEPGSAALSLFGAGLAMIPFFKKSRIRRKGVNLK